MVEHTKATGILKRQMYQEAYIFNQLGFVFVERVLHFLVVAASLSSSSITKLGGRASNILSTNRFDTPLPISTLTGIGNRSRRRYVRPRFLLPYYHTAVPKKARFICATTGDLMARRGKVKLRECERIEQLGQKEEYERDIHSEKKSFGVLARPAGLDDHGCSASARLRS